MPAPNRETWLNTIAAKMAPRFEELGHPLPKFRVSIGWPSAGKDAPVTGECWDKRVSGDEHFEIFLNPGRDDSMAVAATLAHELAHAAVGLDQGHKGNFAKVMLELGFPRPLTHAPREIPEKLAGWLAPMLEELGNLPHSAITYSRHSDLRVKRTGAGVVPVARPDDGDDEGSDGAAPINTRPKTQTTRLRKVICGECGYTARVTAKWLEVGPPDCPKHGAMSIAED